MSPGLQQFLLSPQLFFSTWLKVLSMVSLLRTLSSWRVWFCLPPTHLTWCPASPSQLPSSLPCVTGTSSPKVGPDPFCSLLWACCAVMNCKVKPESGWLAGKVRCNFVHVNDTWRKEVLSVQRRTWENIPAAHLSSHQWSCMGVDVVSGSFILILSFGWYIGIYFKNLQETPLMSSAQAHRVWFFPCCIPHPLYWDLPIEGQEGTRGFRQVVLLTAN